MKPVATFKVCPALPEALQYTEAYYLVTHGRYLNLNAEESVRARRLAEWLTRVEAAWPALHMAAVKNDFSEIRLGDQILLSARVALNALTPEDVAVDQFIPAGFDHLDRLNPPARFW